MTEVYRAPEYDFNEGSGSPGRLLQNGIDGNYTFSAFEAIDETWQKLGGKKGTVWLGWILAMVAAVVVSVALAAGAAALGYAEGWGLLGHHSTSHGKMASAIFSFIQNMLQMAITLPIQLGLFMLNLKLLVKKTVDVSELFQYYGKAPTLLLTTLLMYLLAGIGFLFLILPGIYLLVAYVFANDLVVEKDLAPWEALEASRKAVTHHWWSFFGVFILSFLIMLLAACPLLFGIFISIHMELFTEILIIMASGILSLAVMIWVLPLTVLLKSVIYHKVFGCEGETTEADAMEIAPASA